MSNEVTSPFTVFYDRSGQPLDAGYVYIGTAGINPEVSPISVYWDTALTTPAAQPIRTLAGYPSQNGSPGSIFIGQATYSIVIRDRNGALVYSNLNASENISNVVYLQTYAELTALTTATGLVDDMVVEVAARTTAGDFAGGTFQYKADISARAVVSTKTVSSVNTGTDVLTVTAHGFDTEDVVIASAADAGLSINTLYFVRWISANTITLHTSLLGARANTGLVNITALVGSLSLKHLADPGQGVYVIPTGAALDGSGGGFERRRNRGHIYAAWYGLTLGASGTAAANHLAFEYAMMMCEADGGGIVDVFGTGTSHIEFSSTINNRHDFVLFRGAGASDVHDVAGSTSLGTTLKCTAAVTAFDHVSPYTGGPRKSGGGFEYLTLIAGSHTRALKLDSRRGTTIDITFVGTAGTEGVLVDSGVSFTDLGENADSQRFRKFRVIGLITTGSADVVVFDGSSNANTSITGNIQIQGTVYDGYSLRLRNADHLTVDRLVTNIYPGGSGSSFYCHGTNAGAGTYTSGIEILDWGGGGYVEGTEVAGTTVPARITLRGQDIGNGSPAPTIGTGAEVTYYDDYGRGYFQTSLQSSFGNTIAEANSARALQRGSTQSITVFNSSENHIVLSDGTNTWTFRIAGGNLNFSRTLGSGQFNLPSIAFLLIGGAQLSYGANDSGGVGFKLLRVPN